MLLEKGKLETARIKVENSQSCDAFDFVGLS